MVHAQGGGGGGAWRSVAGLAWMTCVRASSRSRSCHDIVATSTNLLVVRALRDGHTQVRAVVHSTTHDVMSMDTRHSQHCKT